MIQAKDKTRYLSRDQNFWSSMACDDWCRENEQAVDSAGISITDSGHVISRLGLHENKQKRYYVYSTNKKGKPICPRYGSLSSKSRNYPIIQVKKLQVMPLLPVNSSSKLHQHQTIDFRTFRTLGLHLWYRPIILESLISSLAGGPSTAPGC